jgi:hypothetical protein
MALADSLLKGCRCNRAPYVTRQGIADADAPEAAALLEAEAEAAPRGGGPALVEVDFTGLWSDGSAPDQTWLRWVDIDTGESNDPARCRAAGLHRYDLRGVL